MTRRLSVAHLTALDLSPPAFIVAAAKAGFDGAGLRLLRVTDDSPGYPLMDDTAMMRDTRAAMAATGLAVFDIEFIKITRGINLVDHLAMLDAGAALGARHVITASYDPDLSRLPDSLGRLAELAADRGLGTLLEFFPWTSVPNAKAALSIALQTGPNVGILADSLHVDRSDTALSDLASLPTDRMAIAHICDTMVKPPYATEELLETAREERLPPGEGEIDLVGYLNALPKGLPLAAEVPMLERIKRDGAAKVLRDVAEACRWILDQADATR